MSPLIYALQGGKSNYTLSSGVPKKIFYFFGGRNEKLPLLPGLFRERTAGERVEQPPEGRGEHQLHAALPKGDEEIFVTDFFGHIINSDPAAYLFALNKKREQRGLYQIDMTGQFANLDIHIKALGEEVHIELIMAMIFEEIDFIRGHIPFSIIKFKAGFIDDQTAIRNKIFAEIAFITFISTSEAKVSPHFTTFLHILFGEVGRKRGFTSTGDAKVKRKSNLLHYIYSKCRK